MAELVRMLAAAGWSTTAIAEHGNGVSPIALAGPRQQSLTERYSLRFMRLSSKPSS